MKNCSGEPYDAPLAIIHNEIKHTLAGRINLKGSKSLKLVAGPLHAVSNVEPSLWWQ